MSAPNWKRLIHKEIDKVLRSVASLRRPQRSRWSAGITGFPDPLCNRRAMKLLTSGLPPKGEVRILCRLLSKSLFQEISRHHLKLGSRSPLGSSTVFRHRYRRHALRNRDTDEQRLLLGMRRSRASDEARGFYHGRGHKSFGAGWGSNDMSVWQESPTNMRRDIGAACEMGFCKN